MSYFHGHGHYSEDHADYPKNGPKGKLSDFPDRNPPYCYLWSADDVAQWVSSLGFPHYKECVTKNFITGRKLILLEASHLPKMGITDFEDIKKITAAIRKLLTTKLITYDRPIYIPPREPWALFLEQRSATGVNRDKLRYPTFLRNNDLRHSDP